MLSELVYCSHLVGFNDFQSARGVLGCLHVVASMASRAIRDASPTHRMDNPLKIVSADLYWAGDRTARDKAELIKAGITQL